jgi:hypothetical protein
MELVQFLQSKSTTIPEWQELLEYRDNAGSLVDYRTPMLSSLVVGPVDLQAGDVAHIVCNHQFDTENPAYGMYKIGGAQSEHWTLYTMYSLGVILDTKPQSTSGGRWAVKSRGKNWDWLEHHLPAAAIDYYRVPVNMRQAYFFDRLWFEASKSYVVPGQAKCHVLPAAASLSVAIYRG